MGEEPDVELLELLRRLREEDPMLFDVLVQLIASLVQKS
jgi:hypothetical protein